jgi:hypothetical protein
MSYFLAPNIRNKGNKFGLAPPKRWAGAAYYWLASAGYAALAQDHVQISPPYLANMQQKLGKAQEMVYRRRCLLMAAVAAFFACSLPTRRKKNQCEIFQWEEDKYNNANACFSDDHPKKLTHVFCTVLSSIRAFSIIGKNIFFWFFCSQLSPFRLS